MSPAPSDRSERRRRLVLLVALWAFVFVVLVTFRRVVLPFAAAALIAYLVAPVVDRITQVRVARQRLPRWGAILLIYFVFFLLVYLAVIAVVPQIYRELARISRDAVAYSNSLTPGRLQEIARQAEAWLSQYGLPVDLYARSLEGPGAAAPPGWLSIDLERLLHDAAGKVTGLVRDNLGDIVSLSRTIVGGAVAGVFMLFFILMLAAYMSIDAQTIRRYARSLIPAENAADARVLAARIDRSLSGVVRGQMTICMINGVLTLVGLELVGVKFAFLLASVATILSLIPIFGSIISSVPIVSIGLSQGWKTGFLALLWIIGIHALEAYLLNPKIMGTAARIHPIVVAFALIAGERTFGLVGALFAVPLAAIVVACFDFTRQKAQPPDYVPEHTPPPSPAWRGPTP